MKKYILFLTTLFTSSLVSQNTTVTKVGHSEIVEVSGATAQVLSSRATTYLKSKKVETKVAGIAISGTGSFTVSYPSVKKGMTESGYVKFNIKIMVKEGKYKIDLSEFRHEGIKGQSAGGSIDQEKPICGETQISNVAWLKIKEQNQEHLKNFIAELKSNMENPSKSTPAATSDF